MASNVENILRSTIDKTEYSDEPKSRVEALLLELKEAIESGGGGGGDIPLPVSIANGGTGNKNGYIQTGKKDNTDIGFHATAEGTETTSSGNNSHAEGLVTVCSGTNAHAEGLMTTASGDHSHAEGANTTASRIATHAEGSSTKATADNAHSEGNSTEATGMYSHAEGHYSKSTANAAHAEGYYTTASGLNSHSEGANTKAIGEDAHAEGYLTEASGKYSHANGFGTIAGYESQTVVGTYNDNNENTLFEVGNGSNPDNLSNAFEVYSDGHVNINGDIYQNGEKINIGGGGSENAVRFPDLSDDPETLSPNSPNTVPYDGYIIVENVASYDADTYISINGIVMFQGAIQKQGGRYSIFVKKGYRVFVSGGMFTTYLYPMEA